MSTSLIQVLEGGFSTTLQDLGRPYGRRFGVPPGGALDLFAYRAANRLVQNPENAATLEIMLQGPALHFETAALIAVAGADLGAELSDGRNVPSWMSVFVRAGQQLSFRGAGGTNWGRCAYVAVHGGWAAPLVMGSRSTYLRAALGGYRGEGRPVAVGDRLESGSHSLHHLVEGAGRFLPAMQRLPYSKDVRVQVVLGPYLENFAPEALTTLLANPYLLSREADRMGFRLEGPHLPHLRPELVEIESCAAVFGTIQVPPNGQPIVLMADHQVTGGYPILAVVVSRDLPLLAQLPTGGTVSFYI